MLGANSCSHLRAGDLVAVIWNTAIDGEIDEIASVNDSCPLMIVLTDGRVYARWDGVGIGVALGTSIRPAHYQGDQIGFLRRKSIGIG